MANLTSTDRFPSSVGDRVAAYLRLVDVALAGRVEALYLHGSIALGAYREGRSDIDALVVVDDDGLSASELARLRAVHRRLHWREAGRAARRLAWPLVVNASYVRSADLARRPGQITPVASHVAWTFQVGSAFDVNPVTWRILATRGLLVRGPSVDQLAVPQDDADLRQWNRDNLRSYWRGWAAAVVRPGYAALRSSTRQLSTAWGALGAPRLHYTIHHGEIISKEQAGEYARDVFERRWHPVIDDALAYWRGEGRPLALVGNRRRREVAEFVTMVVADVDDEGAAAR